MSYSALKSYKSEYDDDTTGPDKTKLSENDQVLYNAFLHAVETGCPYISWKQSSSTLSSYENVFQLLAQDNPLVGTNSNIEIDREYSIKYDKIFLNAEFHLTQKDGTPIRRKITPAEASPVDMVYFSDQSDPAIQNREESLSIASLTEYSSDFTSYNSTYFKNQLTPEEQALYAAFFHAVELGCPYIYWDRPIETANDLLDFEKVFCFLANDSPLVEANMEVSCREAAYYRKNDTFYIREEYSLTRVSEYAWRKKMVAIDRAKDILSQFSGTGRVWPLYSYLVQNVRKPSDTENYTSTDIHVNYLYDALIDNKTNCDGFSEAMTLLCRLAGIECFSVDSGPSTLYNNSIYRVLRFFKANKIPENELFQNDSSSELFSLKSAFSGLTSDNSEQREIAYMALREIAQKYECEKQFDFFSTVKKTGI